MQRPIRLRTLVLLIFTATLLGCSGTGVFRSTTIPDSPREVYRNIQRDIDALASYSGSATLTLDTPEQSGRIGGEVQITPQEKATIKIQHPFGGYLGTLEFKKNYLLFFDAGGNLQYVGTTDQTGIPGLPVLFSGDQNMVVLLTGLLNLPDQSTATLTGDTLRDQLWVLHYDTPDSRRTYWYSPEFGRITKYTEEHKTTGAVTEIELSGFLKIEGINLPRSIKVVQPGEKRMLSVYYHDISIQKRKNRVNAS